MAKQSTNRHPTVTAVVANSEGEIFELEGYAAVGMAGSSLVILTRDNTEPVPYGGEFMRLPDRLPVVFNLKKSRFETLTEDPHHPGEPIFPVAAFNSPGYVNAYTCAYEEGAAADTLPLFSYGATGWDDEGFCSAVIHVDLERRQDLRLMTLDKVEAGMALMETRLPENRLRQHLETCAMEYGCPAAKNFFIGRCEAPLPVSRSCNAGCLGCISLQKEGHVTAPQDRIGFTPTPEEIADVALAHIRKVDKSVVSFGQGCEGDPLMAGPVVPEAIRRIRAATDRGTINMNTNGSRPDLVKALFEAGLDSIRVSMNSVQEPCYNAYFRPGGYRFQNVMASIETALQMNKFVSINYLNCPGVTDAPEEIETLDRFLTRHPVHLIQWRNLNFDPFRYWEHMRDAAPLGAPAGIKIALKQVQNRFPDVTHGYFNPPKEKF
jgi:pyruvate-formate lyase-activating enzyme